MFADLNWIRDTSKNLVDASSVAPPVRINSPAAHGANTVTAPCRVVAGMGTHDRSILIYVESLDRAFADIEPHNPRQTDVASLDARGLPVPFAEIVQYSTSDCQLRGWLRMDLAKMTSEVGPAERLHADLARRIFAIVDQCLDVCQFERVGGQRVLAWLGAALVQDDGPDILSVDARLPVELVPLGVAQAGEEFFNRDTEQHSTFSNRLYQSAPGVNTVAMFQCT